MKTIKEKAIEAFPIEEYDSLETELQRRKMRLCYEHGANYVLGEIEAFMKNLDLGNSAEEKFYKLDVIADISSFIEQLKK